jgi:soluble lytic murein transglycosylase-like protein
MRGPLQPYPHLSSRLLAAVLVGALTACAALPATAATSFAAARDAHLSGRHPEAVAGLRAYLASSPHDANAWVWLGASYYQMGYSEHAAQAFARAAEIRPSAEVMLWLGACYVRLGRYTDAERALGQAARSPQVQTAQIARQWIRTIRGRAAPVLDEGAEPERYAYVARWYNPALSPEQVDAIVRSVLYFSHRYNVDPRLVMALIAVESGFQITARSYAGAYGLGQLMPETARVLGVNPADPVANIYGTVRYLRGQLDRFGDSEALALAAYNAGRGAVTRYGGIPPYNETQWYVVNVMALYRHLSGT